MQELAKQIQLEVQQGTTVFSPMEIPEGEWYIKLNIAGNSILSTLYVERLDDGASVDVEYYHFASGLFGVQEIQKGQHTIVTSADIMENGAKSDEILVTRIHNKPYIKVKMVGGSGKLSLYCTTLSAFAADLDAALKKDGEIANIETDKYMPTGGYDSINNKWQAVRIKDGALFVVSSPSTAIDGERIFITASFMTSPGHTVIGLDAVVPAGKIWDIEHVVVTSPATFDWSLETDADEWIARGSMGPLTPECTRRWVYTYRLVAGQSLKLFADQSTGYPTNAVDFSASIIQSDM